MSEPLFNTGSRRLRVLGFPQVDIPEQAMRMSEMMEMSTERFKEKLVDCGSCPVAVECGQSKVVLYACKNCGATGPWALDSTKTISMVVHCTKSKFRLPTELYELGSMASSGYFERCLHCTDEAAQYELQGFDPEKDDKDRMVVRMSTPVFVHVFTIYAGERPMDFGGGEYVPSEKRRIKGDAISRRDAYLSALPHCEKYTETFNKELEAEMLEVPSLKDLPPPRVALMMKDPPPFEDDPPAPDAGT